MRYRVLVNWEVSGWVEIDATAGKAANDAVQDMIDHGLVPVSAEFVQDSAQVLGDAELLYERCGCTDTSPCKDDGTVEKPSGMPCHWVNGDTCSRCYNASNRAATEMLKKVPTKLPLRPCQHCVNVEASMRDHNPITRRHTSGTVYVEHGDEVHPVPAWDADNFPGLWPTKGGANHAGEGQ